MKFIIKFKIRFFVRNFLFWEHENLPRRKWWAF
jgi:hypothetical protein